MRSKSLALKTDRHLSKVLSSIVIENDNIIVRGKLDYVYLDYEVVSGGAVFFFVEKAMYLNNTYKSDDVNEIFTEFEMQRIYKTFFDGQKVILSNRYKLVDNDHERFNLERGLKEAELKAIEYMLNK